MGVGGVATLLVAAVVAPRVVAGLATPLAVGGILLGVPHGAVDHVVPGWSAGRALDRGALGTLLAAYAAVVVAVAVALQVAPSPIMAGFLAVSAWHFGRGEVVVQAETAGRSVPGVTQDLLPAAAHGLVTVALPVAAHPRVSLPVLGALAPGLAHMPTSLLRSVVVTVVVVAAAAVARLTRSGRRSEAGELALLAALFIGVHPFAAFGVYFGLWHALRHTARLVELAAGDEPLRVGVRRFVAHGVGPTGVALAFLGTVWATAHAAPSGRSSCLLSAELATLAALTFPHAGVVAFLDARLRRAGAGTGVRTGG